MKMEIREIEIMLKDLNNAITDVLATKSMLLNELNKYKNMLEEEKKV